ncbi:transcriptional regulator [Liquorilactobacillus oeni DSM 19972]|uniref:Transcriptional regulator n=2 Tax=Liquorilactobacillus oeni TaxID=303241 RepID=A0A0R1MGQ0_9LACO|nr:transcriptional regulator [Liquorilactobacillus oeni DSM 19972]
MVSKFSKKEVLLAAFIQSHPQSIVEMSVQKLASEAQVSAATIVRFCHKIGLTGYASLKLALSAAQKSIVTGDYHEIEPGEAASQIIDKLSTHITSALELTKKGLDVTVIEKVVELLHKTASVQLFGLVASSLTVQDMYQKFNRIGIPTIQSSDLHMAVTSLSAASPQTLLLCVSNSGESVEVIQLLRLARKKKVISILLTSRAASGAAELANHVLLTKSVGESAIRPGATTSVMMQLFVADLLLFRYVAKFYSEVEGNLNQSQQNIEKVEQKKLL